MRFPVPAPKPVSIRSPRWLVGSIAIFLAFILVAADSAVPNAHDPGISRLTPVADAEVDTPEQEDGSADGLSHEWEADEPESDGSGRPPDAVDPPDGALPHEWPELPEDAEPDAPPEDPEPLELMEEEPEPEVEGFDAETSVELEGERDEYSRTYENADGTLATDFSLEPLHYKDEDGSWAEIDPSLEPLGTDIWTNAADSRNVEFAASADAEELARLELDEDHSIAFQLQGADAAEGQVDEEEPNTIRYSEALPGTDIELSAQSEGVVKETIWLERPPSSPEEASWRFALELEGLEPELAEDRAQTWPLSYLRFN